jgi:hypothetical protein
MEWQSTVLLLGEFMNDSEVLVVNYCPRPLIASGKCGLASSLPLKNRGRDKPTLPTPSPASGTE